MTTSLLTLTRAGSVGRDALWSVVLHGASLAVTFAAGVTLARILGPAQYGSLAYVLALAAVAASALTFGMPNTLTRRIALHRSRKEDRQISALWRLAGGATALGSTLITIAAAAVIALTDAHSTVSAQAWFLGLVSIPLAAVASTAGGALRGMGHGIASLIISNLLRPAAWLVLLTAWYFWLGRPLDYQDALAAYAGAAVFALAVALAACRRALPPVPAAGLQHGSREVCVEALPFMIISVLAVLGTRLDLILISAVLGAHDAGLYEVASRGADLVLIPITATTVVLAPEFARRASLEPHALQRLATLASWGLFGASLLIALPLALFAGPIIAAVFGSAYADSAQTLTILSVGYALMMAMGPVHVVLGMTGHSRDSAIAAVSALVAGAILSLLLMPRFGLAGAAFARALSQVCAAVWLALLIRRRLGIQALCWPLLPRALASAR